MLLPYYPISDGHTPASYSLTLYSQGKINPSARPDINDPPHGVMFSYRDNNALTQSHSPARTMRLVPRALLQLLLLQLAALLVLSPARCSAQELPSRPEPRPGSAPPVGHPALDEQEEHATALPDGAELTDYLLRDTSKRFYLVVEEDNTPLWLVLTPCDASLEWTLRVEDLPEEASGGGSGDSEPFRAQQPETRRPASEELHSYRGNSMESYAVHSANSGLYILEVFSPERDTSFKVYASTASSPGLGDSYPQLPADSRLDVTWVGRSAVTLSWKSSWTTALSKDTAVRYCLLANRDHNVKSLCGAETKLGSGPVPPVPLARDLNPYDFAYLGFSTDLLPRAPPPPAVSHGPSRSDVFFTCLDDKTVYTVSELKPDTQYYFDVFAVNPRTNMSVSYIGTFVRTKSDGQAEKVTELKEGKVTELTVKPRGGDREGGGGGAGKNLRFRPVSSHQHVLFSFHTCQAANAIPLRVAIRRDGKLLSSVSLPAGGLRHLRVRGRPKAAYTVRVSGNAGARDGSHRRRHPRHQRQQRRRQQQHQPPPPLVAATLRVSATSRPGKQPFPELPDDTRIKVFDRLRACNAVTVAWLCVPERQKYCLYKRPVGAAPKGGGGGAVASPPLGACFGPESRKKSEKVLCKEFSSADPRRAVLAQTVRGLEPGRAYVLDVYAVAPGGEAARYQSRMVTTRSRC
ncbi:unnamed protein product [Lampetra planeri]